GGVDRARRTDEKERTAVRRRSQSRFGCDVGAGAWPILDDERLAESLREPLSHYASDDVVSARGGEANQDSYRPRRIGLRRRKRRRDWQHRSAGSELQQSSAGKFHAALPAVVWGTSLPAGSTL